MNIEKKSKSIPRSTHMRKRFTTSQDQGNSSYQSFTQSQPSVNVTIKDIFVFGGKVKIPFPYDNVNEYPLACIVTYDQNRKHSSINSNNQYRITNVTPSNSLGGTIFKNKDKQPSAFGTIDLVTKKVYLYKLNGIGTDNNAAARIEFELV